MQIENTSAPTPTTYSIAVSPSLIIEPTSHAISTSTTIPTSTPTDPPEPETTIPPGENPTALISEGDLVAVVGLAADQVLELKESPGTNTTVMDQIPSATTGLIVGGPSQRADGQAWLPVIFKDKNGWVDSAFLAKQYGRPGNRLAETALTAIQAIKTQDYPSLSAMVGEAGLRFSPYGYIRQEDQSFTAEQIYTILADSKIFHWGVFDGSGEPIDLSFPAYYDRFVYDVDFAQPQAIGFNTTIGTGNTMNNLTEFYPGADFVEYHFYGFDPQYGGMDWRSLRLVFQPSEDGYNLVGIVHDQWTI